MSGLATWNWHAGALAAVAFIVLVGGAALIQQHIDKRRHRDMQRRHESGREL